MNFLLTGAGDPRHLLYTWAGNAKSRQNHSFFIHERHPEVLSRYILLLDILFDPALSPRERVEIFFEVYGNTLTRERTATYVSGRVDTLQDLVYGEAPSHPLAQAVDFSLLSEKEKDALTEAIKGWSIRSGPFDIESLRDQRSRHAYGTRFDARVNLFDYDYNVGVLGAGASILHWREFKLFRHIGLAFEPRTAAYKTPNKTLGAYVKAEDKKTGRPVMVRGYWGDIMNGPFYGFGIDTDNEHGDKDRLFKKFSEQHRHYSAEVGEFNLTKLLVAIYLGETFGLKPKQEAEESYPFKSPLDSLEGFEHRDAERTQEEKEKNKTLEAIAEEDEEEDCADEEDRSNNDSKKKKDDDVDVEEEFDVAKAGAGPLSRVAQINTQGKDARTLLPGLQGLQKIVFLLGDLGRATDRLAIKVEQDPSAYSHAPAPATAGKEKKPKREPTLEEMLSEDYVEEPEDDDVSSPAPPSSSYPPFQIHGAFVGSMASTAAILAPSNLLTGAAGEKDFIGDFDDTRSPFGTLDTKTGAERVSASAPAFTPTPANPSVPGEICGCALFPATGLPLVDRLFLGPDGYMTQLGKGFKPVLMVESFKYQAHFSPAVKLKFRSRTHQAANRLGFKVVDAKKSTPSFDIPAGGPIEEAKVQMKMSDVEKDAEDVLVFTKEVDAAPAICSAK